MKCVACGNYCSRFNRSTRYFRIPHIDLRIRDAEGRILMEKRQDAWLNALNIKKPKNEQLLRNMRVCSTHFVSGKPSKLYEKEDVDWIPTLRLGNDAKVKPKRTKAVKSTDNCKNDNSGNDEQIITYPSVFVSCGNIIEIYEPESE